MGPDEQRARLERKLCIAKESPSPAFDLTSCSLRRVPDGVYSVVRVLRKEALLLDDNLLRDVGSPSHLADLRLLQLLSLSHNRLERLSPDIHLLASLTELRLDHNRLQVLPDQLGLLRNLRVLDISHNSLKCLPPALADLACLTTLSMQENPPLKTLPDQFCNLTRLKTLNLDPENFVYPPEDVLNGGIVQIMKFLCRQSDREYVEPSETDGPSPERSLYRPVEYENALKSQLDEWEARDGKLLQLETEIHEASKKRRERFLEDFITDQKKMDDDLNKIQHDRDADRDKLITQIRYDENLTEQTVRSLLRISLSEPRRIRQYLEHDQKERDRLLEMCRKNYIDLKKTDTLKAMEALLQEECEYDKSLKTYGESQDEVARSFLSDELDSESRLVDLLKAREKSQSELVDDLLRDEDLQKAAVGILLEKCDARTWGLVQEIHLVEGHLAKLSMIELDRRRLELDENLDNLADHRIKLSLLLVDLLEQQELRRLQLVDTLQAMELEKKTSSDFWLIQYQQLLETLPEKIVASQQQLDPVLANYLLQEGVIHCLPFLVFWVSSRRDLISLTDDMLKDQGVRLNVDRTNILKAVKMYIDEMKKLEDNSPPIAAALPSAPLEEDVAGNLTSTDDNSNSECIVCMENNCEVVFIPCGHMCCCVKCSNSIEKLCPMCRQDIERKIRIIKP